jgi:hypothetical protein
MNEINVDAVIPLNNQVQLYVENDNGPSEFSSVFVATPDSTSTWTTKVPGKVVDDDDDDYDDKENNREDTNIGQIRKYFEFFCDFHKKLIHLIHRLYNTC